MQPLNAARLFSAALSQQAEGMNDEAQQLVQHMDSSLRSAEELISDLLDISRLENGKITPTPSLRPQRAVRHPGRRIQAAGGRKGPGVPPARQPPAGGQRHETAAPGAAELPDQRPALWQEPDPAGRAPPGRALWLEVWDRGPGIADDKLQVIFQEFKRLDSHQTRAEKGLGLGLAIADGLCRVLGHPLEVRSWPGKGSVFRVSVPIARRPPAPRPGGAAASHWPGRCCAWTTKTAS
jgi:signal transduction histidine kinase